MTKDKGPARKMIEELGRAEFDKIVETCAKALGQAVNEDASRAEAQVYAAKLCAPLFEGPEIARLRMAAEMVTAQRDEYKRALGWAIDYVGGVPSGDMPEYRDAMKLAGWAEADIKASMFEAFGEDTEGDDEPTPEQVSAAKAWGYDL